jgi:SAM-dependent methyltransferase
VDRVQYIISHCRGLRVLHVGCTSPPTTRERYRAGILLHLLLSEAAAELWGVDIDRDAVSYLRGRGVRNLLVGNAEQLGRARLPSGKRFDVVLAGELIEHLGNPLLFLEGARRLLTPGGRLVLSTVNALSLKRAPRILWRSDVTHPDHTFTFTYSNLNRLLALSHLRISEFRVFYWREGDLYLKQPRRVRVLNGVLRRIPALHYLADGFVFTAVPEARSAGLRGPSASPL